MVAIDSTSDVIAAVNTGTNGELYPKVPPWTANVPAATQDTLVIRRYAIRPELQWYLPDGHEQRIMRVASAAGTDDGRDRALYSDDLRCFLAQVGSNRIARSMLPDLDDWRDVSRSNPFFDKIRVDDAGDVWVLKDSLTLEPYEHFSPVEDVPSERRMIFNPSGRWLGDLEMRDGFALHTIARGKVHGVTKGSLDVETVRLYRIVK